MSEESVPLALNADESPPAGLRRVALALLDVAIAELDVHEARKRTKELRAISRLVPRSKTLRAALRDVARRLSASRDADAMIESFDKLRKRFAEPWGKRRFGKIRRGLVARKTSAEVPDAEALRALRPAIEAWDADDLFDGLSSGYRKARRAMRAAFAARTPEQFHEWRKRIKDHWYHTRLIESAWPPVLEPQAKALHDLSRLLGDHHDLVVLRTTLREHPSEFASTRLLRAFDAFVVLRLAEVEEEAGELGLRLLADKPDAWLRRIRTYWNVWRGSERKGPKRAAARATVLAYRSSQ